MPEYLRPTTLDDALAALHSRRLTVLAGGTDFYPGQGWGRRSTTTCSTSPRCNPCARSRSMPIIGAFRRSRPGRISSGPTCPPWFDGLKLAAREIGGRPGAECRHPLRQSVQRLARRPTGVHGAAQPSMPRWSSPRWERRQTMPLAGFIHGNRATVLAPDQLMVAVRRAQAARRAGARALPQAWRAALPGDLHRHGGGSAGGRRGGPDRPCRSPRSAPARRSPGRPACAGAGARRPPLCDAALGDAVTDAHMAPLAPMDDARGSAAYRLDAARTLTARTLAELGSMI